MNSRALKHTLPALLLALSACGGGGGAGAGGGSPAGNTLEVDEFRFKGKALAAGAGATVTATVGGLAFDAVTEDGGVYALDVPTAALRDGEVLRLEVKGAGEHADAHLVSTFGDAGALEQRAGTDRTLTRDEAIDVDVSDLSTAKYAVLYAANGKQHIASSAQYRELERDRLTADRVAILAAAARLVATGRTELPAAAGTTWELLSNPSTASRFIGELRSGSRQVQVKQTGAFAKTSEDPDPVIETVEELLADAQPFTTALVPDEYVFVERTRSDLELRAQVFRFNADGTGTHISPAGENTMTWRIDENGRLEILPEAGKRIQFENPGSKKEDAKELIEQEIVGPLYLTLLRQGHSTDLLTILYRVVDADIDGSESFDPSGARVMLRAATGVKPAGFGVFKEAELADKTWAMPGIGSDVTQGREISVRQVAPLAPHLFAEPLLAFAEDGTGTIQGLDGNGAITDTGEAFGWSIGGEGELVVTFGDGATVTYRKAGADGIAYDVIVSTLSDENENLVNAGLAVPLDDAVAFTAENVAGAHVRYGNGAGRFELQGFAPLIVDFATEERDDGFNGIVNMPIWQELDLDSDKAWKVDADGSVAIGAFGRRVDGDGGFDPACTAASDCYQAAQIRLIPLAREGDRVYTLEVEDLYYFTGDTSKLHDGIATRRLTINYWEPQVVPED